MRILLSIMLILVMASAADATLTVVASGRLAVADSIEFGIDVVGEKASLAGALVTEGSSVLSVDSAGVKVVDMGIDEFVVDLSGDPDMLAFLADLGITDVVSALYYEVIDLSPTPRAIPDGALIDNVFMTLISAGCGAVHIVDMSAGEVIASAEACKGNWIPEPATIGLLGLGWLFVRRRRKKMS